MGQYQQWLQYQEIHKGLSSQAEAFEEELAHLKDCLDQLEQQRGIETFIENPIVQALIAHLPFLPDSPTNNASNGLETHSLFENGSNEPGESISPALRGWGELPNLELYEVNETSLHDNHTSSFFKHSGMELLPEDMSAFFDEHQQTDPQLELPWWLRKITVSSKDEQAGRPIDHNSIRTNRLVQRWIERWGRQPSTALTPAKNKEESSDE